MQDEGQHCWTLGYKFVKCGLIWFILGLFLSLGVLIYYLVGSEYPVGGDFTSHVQLWWGSPLTYSTAMTIACGLGMAIFGAACNAMFCALPGSAAATADRECGNRHAPLALANVGLILLVLCGYVGYFIIDAGWNGFYFMPHYPGKALFLCLMGGSVLIYIIGLLMAYSHLCCCCNRTTRR